MGQQFGFGSMKGLAFVVIFLSVNTVTASAPERNLWNLLEELSQYETGCYCNGKQCFDLAVAAGGEVYRVFVFAQDASSINACALSGSFPDSKFMRLGDAKYNYLFHLTGRGFSCDEEGYSSDSFSDSKYVRRLGSMDAGFLSLCKIYRHIDYFDNGINYPTHEVTVTVFTKSDTVTGLLIKNSRYE